MRRKNKFLKPIFWVPIFGVIIFGSVKLGQKLYERSKIKYADYSPDIEMIKTVEKKIKVTPIPNYEYSYTEMKPGVIQHLDRGYTYDIIPEELYNGILFQGIHKPPKKTRLKIEVYEPMTIYFFFHSGVDGGYSNIFSNLEGWVKCTIAPQYDIDNGDHGKDMTMYRFEAKKGIYLIPPTSKENACFNIVFIMKMTS